MQARSDCMHVYWWCVRLNNSISMSLVACVCLSQYNMVIEYCLLNRYVKKSPKLNECAGAKLSIRVVCCCCYSLFCCCWNRYDHCQIHNHHRGLREFEMGHKYCVLSIYIFCSAFTIIVHPVLHSQHSTNRQTHRRSQICITYSKRRYGRVTYTCLVYCGNSILTCSQLNTGRS